MKIYKALKLTMEKEVKYIKHADDMTLTLLNIESFKHALETKNKFCIHAGFKLNISKTECIVLGMLTEIEGISVTNKAVKCLGIHVGHDKIECYNKNWMKIYYDIDTLFESWKRRKLIWEMHRNKLFRIIKTHICCKYFVNSR